MAGTFASLNTALSALRYNRVAMDVASGNIANVGTDGYVRRRAVAATVGQSLQPAMWSRSDGVGDGVTVSSVDRMTDALLDVRARREHGNQSYLDIRQTVLERVESGIGEPGDNGVADQGDEPVRRHLAKMELGVPMSKCREDRRDRPKADRAG